MPNASPKNVVPVFDTGHKGRALQYARCQHYLIWLSTSRTGTTQSIVLERSLSKLYAAKVPQRQQQMQSLRYSELHSRPSLRNNLSVVLLMARPLHSHLSGGGTGENSSIFCSCLSACAVQRYVHLQTSYGAFASSNMCR